MTTNGHIRYMSLIFKCINVSTAIDVVHTIFNKITTNFEQYWRAKKFCKALIACCHDKILGHFYSLSKYNLYIYENQISNINTFNPNHEQHWILNYKKSDLITTSNYKEPIKSLSCSNYKRSSSYLIL